MNYPAWPPQHAYAPPRPSHAPAYITAALYGVCSIFALVVTLISWDGKSTSVEAVLTVPGMLLSEDITGNVDFGISMGMSVACTFALFAILLAARLSLARWLSAILGGLVVAYYLYAVIKVIADGGGKFVAALVLTLVLWLIAEILVFLPAVANSMRGPKPAWPPRY